MREIVATPLFDTRLAEILEHYAERGATKLLARFEKSFSEFTKNLEKLDKIGVPYVWRTQGKAVHVRKFAVSTGSRAFTILYWIPPDDADESEPILLINVKGGLQNRFKWVK